jgi:hypothetical protein
MIILIYVIKLIRRGRFLDFCSIEEDKMKAIEDVLEKKLKKFCPVNELSNNEL